MNDQEDEQQDDLETIGHSGQSVIEFIQKRTGEATRITLREEDSAAAAVPLINPRSNEKSSVPQGRGTYQLMGEIARGGMGVILKGHDTDLGRDVAVKVLDRRLSKRDDVVARFVEEAQIGGQLQHPGIVPVYELGLLADERPYFTMKLVKGRTLATLLTERETPASNRRNLIDIFESVCQTMAYAHSRGVIHRDLKPANIMVGAFGEVQVVDWGLAKVMTRGGTADEKRAREMHSSMTILETVRSDGSGSGSASMVGSILGTPAYMPPEQAAGLVDRLDERTDVFALGAILCEILTGLPPYVGERDEIIAAAAQADYEGALKRLDACGADADLVKLTKQCLMAAPAARPANASTVAERVHQHIVSLEERAHAAQVEAAEARVRVKEEQKARKLTLALGGSVTLILLVLVGGWSFLEQERADQERVEAARAAEAALRASELTAEVNGTLAEASLLEASESWDEAVQVAERAKALAVGGGASPAVVGRVDEVLGKLRGAQAALLARQEREADTLRLLAELNEEREPDWSSIEDNQITNATNEAARLEQTFLAHGIDLMAGSKQEAAALLTDRGLGVEVALILDGWVQHLHEIYDEPKAERLNAIAHLVDPDPIRADLREAFARRELAVLEWIANEGLDMQPPGTIELLGSSFLRLEQREQARRVFRAGADLYPEDFSLQFRLGRLLVPPGVQSGETADLAEGAACLHAALALRPESNVVRFYLGRILHKLGLHEQSLEQFKLLYRRTPDEENIRFHLAWEYLHVEDYPTAISFFDDLVGVTQPNWIAPFSYGGRGRAYLLSGELTRAVDDLERAVRWVGFDFIQWQSDLIEAYMSQDFDLAEAIRRVEDGFPANAGIHNNLAWTLLMQRPTDENYRIAVRLAERAVEIEPSAVYWNTLGTARRYAGQPEGALIALEKSVSLDGWNPYDSLVMAMAYFDSGQFQAAEAEYARAVEHLHKNPTLDPELLRFREDARKLFGR